MEEELDETEQSGIELRRVPSPSGLALAHIIGLAHTLIVCSEK